MNVDFGYVNYEDLEDSELVPIVHPDSMDRGAWENFFHTLSQEQLEVLVCLCLGLSPEESVKTLQFPNIQRFYNINVKLKRSYREQKERLLEYN